MFKSSTSEKILYNRQINKNSLLEFGTDLWNIILFEPELTWYNLNESRYSEMEWFLRIVQWPTSTCVYHNMQT